MEAGSEAGWLEAGLAAGLVAGWLEAGSEAGLEAGWLEAGSAAGWLEAVSAAERGAGGGDPGLPDMGRECGWLVVLGGGWFGGGGEQRAGSPRSWHCDQSNFGCVLLVVHFTGPPARPPARPSSTPPLVTCLDTVTTLTSVRADPPTAPVCRLPGAPCMTHP